MLQHQHDAYSRDARQGLQGVAPQVVGADDNERACAGREGRGAQGVEHPEGRCRSSTARRCARS
ncbi:hypothetical protein [Streptomyces erythrochromogenes]|uniref:hypothetical protein n=1 Tax=Streptomyces erythrochromogenes TaxID=285574 RepID=UPI00380939AF